MKWFGKFSWGAPVCASTPHVETPVDDVCIHCEEDIQKGDSGIIYANGYPSHLNCFLRQLFGSVAHIEGRCSCKVPGSTEGDPEGMTPREAANAAVAAFYRNKQK